MKKRISHLAFLSDFQFVIKLSKCSEKNTKMLAAAATTFKTSTSQKTVPHLCVELEPLSCSGARSTDDFCFVASTRQAHGAAQCPAL